MTTSNNQLSKLRAVRPSLSTSLSDFALPSSSSSFPSSSAQNGQYSALSQSKDDSAPLMRRLRRPSYAWWPPESHVNSPLSSSFSLTPSRRAKGKERCRGGEIDDEAGTGFRDKDRMTTDSSSPSSESDVPTPPLKMDGARLEELSERPKSSPMDISRSASPASALKPPADIQESPGPSRIQARRQSCPPKPPRLQTLRAEARPEESEVKSEAQFQRLLASFSGLPHGLGQGRSPRAPSDRGRYPEEAPADDEFQREETPSDDGFDTGDANNAPPIPSTPASSNIGVLEDLGSTPGLTDSPGMDVDVPTYSLSYGSPSLNTGIPPPQQWRQTPPPTTVSAVRTAKRKYEDRFDPYAPTAKRRAVSPSISQLKEREGYSLVSPIVIPRSPVLRSRNSFSHSQNNSATSSPTVSHNSSGHIIGNNGSFSLPLSQSSGTGNGFSGHHRSGSSSSVVASPTVRASMMLASPILRPIPRLPSSSKRVIGEEEKIVDGTGENLKDLNIGR